MDIELDGPLPCTQQAMIESLPIGESVSIAQRVDLTFGIGDRDKAAHAERLRGRLDQMIYRARRKHKGRQYKNEVVYALATQSAAIFIIAVCTRTN